jgi:hypothetical protein
MIGALEQSAYVRACTGTKIWRSSWQISTERKLLLKKTSAVRDKNTGKT